MAQAEFQGEEEAEINSSWYSHVDPSMSQIDPLILGLAMNNAPPSQMTFQVQNQVHLQGSEYSQQTIQRFMDEHERSSLFNPPSIHNSQVFPRGVNRPGAPTQALPQVNSGFMRNASPSLSQGLSSATSAPSPNTEYDWYPESRFHSQHREEYNIHADYYASPPSFASSPPAMDSHFYQQYSLPAAVGNSCVNMSQVQGFADPQEVTFEADESYDDTVLKDEYNMSFEKNSIKTESRQPESHLYEYHTDSAVGSSIKDAPSPDEISTQSIHAGDDAASDIDAEGEADNDDIIEVEQASDTEYTPRSTRTRKRPTTTPKSTSTPNKTRGRVTKSTPNKAGKLTCKSCDILFKDIATLTKHIATAHTRAFVCVFAFAGCASTFASKNEWKRHVSSQHLNLTAWVCEIGTCGKIHNHSSSKSGGAVLGTKGGSEFNRKDLFTQHLRRMHAPHSVKRKKEVDEKWEKELKDLQVSCLKVKREAPTKLGCCVDGCPAVFEGPNTWDDRMEHVGKHLEKAAAAGERDIGRVVDQGKDRYLVSWALRERIIEERPDHTLRLCVGKKDNSADDEDAEGEME